MDRLTAFSMIGTKANQCFYCSDEDKLKHVVWSVVVSNWPASLFVIGWLEDVDGSSLHCTFFCPIMRQSGDSVPSTSYWSSFLYYMCLTSSFMILRRSTGVQWCICTNVCELLVIISSHIWLFVSFYTYRVWKLSERSRLITGLILFLIVCCAGCGTG